MSKRAEDLADKIYPFRYDSHGDVIDFKNTIILRGVCIEIYEQAEKDLGWHSVEESLPPMDEEVIALSDTARNGKPLPSADWICFAHIVDKKYCKDYNGWNIPGVKYWMPCPKLPEE